MASTLGVILLLTKTLFGFVTVDALVVAVLLRDLLGVLYIVVCLLHSLLLQFLLEEKVRGGSLGCEKWNIWNIAGGHAGGKKNNQIAMVLFFDTLRLSSASASLFSISC